MGKIKVKRGSGVPSGLTAWEIAYDFTNDRFYIGNTTGASVLLAYGGGGVASVNGATGAVTNIAVTNAAQTFTGIQSFTTGISASGGTFSGQLNAQNFKALAVGGDEGGQIDFGLPVTGTSLTGGVSIDVYQNRVRIFESAGTNRGVYIDLAGVSAGVGTNLVGGGGGAVSSVTGSGTGISVSPTTGSVIVQNTGVHSFNGLTGAVTGVNSVNGSTGAIIAVNSFNGRTGAVQGVSAASAGTGISLSGSTGAITITNTGVVSFNGLTGTVTGVSSVNGSTGSIAAVNSFNGRTGAVQGVSSASAGTGIALSGSTGAITITNIGVQSFNGATGAVSGVSSLDYGYGPQTGAVDITGVMFDTYNVWGYPQEFSGQAGSFLGYPALKVKSTAGPEYISIDCVQTPSNEAEMEFGGATYSTILKRASTTVGDYTVYLPENSGYLITSGGAVTSVNGATGAVTNVAFTNITNNFTTSQYITDSTSTLQLGNSSIVFDGAVGPSLISTNSNTHGIDISSPFNVIKLGDPYSSNNGTYVSIDDSNSRMSMNNSMDIYAVPNIYFTNGEYLRNSTNGRVDIMPAPAGTTHYGIYFDMTSWGFGVVMGTVRSSDGALNTGGNFRFDVPLTILNDTRFQLGSDGHYGLYRTDTGNNTAQLYALSNNANNSGAFAIVGYFDVGNANRSPGITHVNPNLYIYANGVTSANDFIRFEHNRTNGNIVSGGTTGILIQPGSGTVGISGGVSAGAFILDSTGIKNVTGTTYTFLATDNGDVLIHNNGSGSTFTIPTGLPVGFSTTVIQIGAGQVNFSPASGVTLNSFTSLRKIAGQHGSASLVSYQTDIYNLAGNLA
jgi:hypothetical protein